MLGFWVSLDHPVAARSLKMHCKMIQWNAIKRVNPSEITIDGWYYV